MRCQTYEALNTAKKKHYTNGNSITISKDELSPEVRSELQGADDKRKYEEREERKGSLIQMGEDRSQKNVLAQMVRAAVSGRTDRALSLWAIM